MAVADLEPETDWITVSMVPTAKRWTAFYLTLDLLEPAHAWSDEQVRSARPVITDHSVLGLLVQHRYRLDASVPVESRTVWAVFDTEYGEIIAADDVGQYESLNRVHLLGVYRADERPSDDERDSWADFLRRMTLLALGELRANIARRDEAAAAAPRQGRLAS